MGATGASRHLWVAPATDRGDIYLDDGRYFWDALRSDGPSALHFPVWFQQMPESGGSQLCDMLWDTSGSGVKIVSLRLARTLQELDPTLEEAPVDVRDRKGQAISGYVALLERVDELTPVHSHKRGVRGNEFVVSADVQVRVKKEKFRGLEWEAAATPYPGDEPLPPLLPLP